MKDGSQTQNDDDEATNYDDVYDKHHLVKKLSFTLKDSQEHASFLKAAFDGDLHALENQITQGADLLARVSTTGETALHLAARRGHPAIISKLVSLNKHLLKLVDQDGYTPLLTAAYYGEFEVIETLLRYGANLCETDKSGNTVSHFVAENGHTAIIAKLPSHMLELTNNEGRTSFHTTSSYGRLRSLEALLARNVNALAKDSEGNTALHLAIVDERFDIVLKLITIKDLLEVENKEGFTPLHTAAVHGFPDTLEALLKQGANLLAQNSQSGNTALHFAARTGDIEIILMLVNKNKDILNVLNNFQCSALMVAMRHGYKESTKALLNLGASISGMDKNRLSTLHYATLKQNMDIIELFAFEGLPFTHKNRFCSHIPNLQGLTALQSIDPSLFRYDFGLSRNVGALVERRQQQLKDNALYYLLDILNSKSNVSGHDIKSCNNLEELQQQKESTTSSGDKKVEINCKIGLGLFFKLPHEIKSHTMQFLHQSPTTTYNLRADQKGRNVAHDMSGMNIFHVPKNSM